MSPPSVDPFRGYRRRVQIDPRPFEVSAWLEDDFHHFGVELVHDGVAVGKVVTHAPRYPWATCPAAASLLEARFQGVRLDSFGAGEDQRQHCTHFYDLAMAAARNALRAGPIVYEISVNDLDGLAELAVDGEATLAWRFGPSGEIDGVRSGDIAAFQQWTRTLPQDLAEAAMMFRRAAPISGGRRIDLEGFKTASEVGPTGACYTFQPARAGEASRILGAIRDFSANPEAMLRE